MKHRVVVHRAAWDDLDAAYQYAAKHAPQTAAAWLDKFEAALQTLEYLPHRCSLARENKHFPFELRELHYGGKPFVYRVVYVVDGETVRILRICRAQQDELSESDIKNSLSDE